MNLIRDRWMFVPVAFLSITVTVAVTTVSLAVVGRPVGAEPEYYAKAAAWDEELAQRAANDRLRWNISPEIEPGADGRPHLTLRIHDKYAGVIDAETVTVEAIPVANADLRETIGLRRVGEGHFDAPLSARVQGQWEFRVRVTKGESVYTDTFRRTLRFAVRSARASGGEP
jgi:nitrogen fixation protein FixH